MLEALKNELCELHRLLPGAGLVAWTSGNISARDPQSGLVVIKPSGVRYEHLRPEQHVVVDLNGRVAEADASAARPSSDTASHLYIYRERPDIFGIVHTHSPYATAFAALGRSIPCCLTAIADEFGGPIPCAGFALIGGEEIGREVVAHLDSDEAGQVGDPGATASCRCPAVLLKHHGVFTVGRNAEAAVKAAVMVEDAARTAFLAFQLGHAIGGREPERLADDVVERLHRRYRQEYGQPGA